MVWSDVRIGFKNAKVVKLIVFVAQGLFTRKMFFQFHFLSNGERNCVFILTPSGTLEGSWGRGKRYWKD